MGGSGGGKRGELESKSLLAVATKWWEWKLEQRSERTRTSWIRTADTGMTRKVPDCMSSSEYSRARTIAVNKGGAIIPRLVDDLQLSLLYPHPVGTLYHEYPLGHKIHSHISLVIQDRFMMGL
ncbi:hypothetical protein Tco_1429643 [Tanacetum coccineum]|uniref:Uncharacterized protein n=1 Tax=Tanacetum coccineum TaxID=301880 RepID=A0ABQ5GG05_9ASTR